MRWSGQRREQDLGGWPVVGDERPDLVALAARSDDAPASEPDLAHERTAHMSRRADRSPQEGWARRGKNGRVASFEHREWDIRQRNDTRRRSRRGRQCPAKSDCCVADEAAGSADLKFPALTAT